MVGRCCALGRETRWWRDDDVLWAQSHLPGEGTPPDNKLLILWLRGLLQNSPGRGEGKLVVTVGGGGGRTNGVR